MLYAEKKLILHHLLTKGGYDMSLADKIIKNVKALPESKQIEILDFIEWTDFSL